MTTSHSPRASVIDRLAARVLDVDGDLWGSDERERLWWYEGVCLAATVQWVVVPWVAAVLVWQVSEQTVRALGTLGLAFMLPMLLTTLYVSHRHVDVTPRWTRKRIIWTLLTMLPFVIFVAGYLRATSNLNTATIVGMFVGGAAGVVGLMMAARTRTTSADSDD